MLDVFCKILFTAETSLAAFRTLEVPMQGSEFTYYLNSMYPHCLKREPIAEYYMHCTVTNYVLIFHFCIVNICAILPLNIYMGEC